jgi:hypothetical protein
LAAINHSRRRNQPRRRELLERREHLGRRERREHLEHLHRREQLERRERREHLEHLERLEHLENKRPGIMGYILAKRIYPKSMKEGVDYEIKVIDLQIDSYTASLETET